MGRKVAKGKANQYISARDKFGWSREVASEKIGISASRIEQIENEKITPSAYDVATMAKGYNCPELCHQYCADECEIGRECVPKVEIKNLSQIVLEMIASLNSMENKKNRLIEITVDGKIGDDEIEDFMIIKEELERISIAVEALKLWVDKTAAEGNIDLESYKK